MPAAHVEFFGGPLDGTQATLPEQSRRYSCFEQGESHGMLVRHNYHLRTVLDGIPVKLPGGRFAMDYKGVTTETKNP